jgi:hypothetical protein
MRGGGYRSEVLESIIGYIRNASVGDRDAITDLDALPYYANNAQKCKTGFGLTKRTYPCYNKFLIDDIYKHFLETFAIKYIIDDIKKHIESKASLTFEKVEEIYNTYKENINYRKKDIEFILDHLKAMQQAPPSELEATKAELETTKAEVKPTKAEVEPRQEEQQGGARKRRSRKREIKRRGRKSRKH